MLRDLICKYFKLVPKDLFDTLGKIADDRQEKVREQREEIKTLEKKIQAGRDLVTNYSDQLAMLESAVLRTDYSDLYRKLMSLEDKLYRMVPPPKVDIASSRRLDTSYDKLNVFTVRWEIDPVQVTYTTTPGPYTKNEVQQVFLRKFRQDIVPELEYKLQENLARMFKDE